MNDANQLLREYAANGSEVAFRELVTRYVDLVYSAALRRMRGDAHRAEEVTQTVFTDLARKAESLSERVMLGGWLHRHTGFVASNLIRGEIRRQAREKEAATMMLHESDESTWQEIAPYLDEAIDQLEAADREAILLRYFEKRDLRSLGAMFGVSEDAAQKRVSRAVDKLREMLLARGVALTTALLGTLLTERAVMAGPVGLAAGVGSKALQSLAPAGAMSGGLTLLSWGLFKGAFAVLAIIAAVAVVGWPERLHMPFTASEGDHPVAEVKRAPRSVPSTSPSKAPVTVAAVEPVAIDATRTNLIRLKLVADVGGQPVTAAIVKVRQWEDKKVTEADFKVNEVGEAEVLVARGTVTKLELRTQGDGYADKRLLWSPADGKTLPESYVVRLEQAVTISGRVLDADGLPAAGATVALYHDINPQWDEVFESHEFGSIETLTDGKGHWRLSRIANGMISRVVGKAKHDLWIESPVQFVTQTPEMEGQLRQGTHVLRLARPVTVRGVVVDPEGMPVQTDMISIRSLNARSGKTNDKGEFEITHCKPGTNSLNVYVKGFVPFTQEVVLVEGMEPFRIMLQRGNTLRLRVVNTVGEPIPGALIFMSSYDNGATKDKKSPVPDLNMECGPDGRTFLPNAPDRELILRVRAPGYMSSSHVKVPAANDMEQQIVLQPALVIEGTVKDAETGQPLPKFRILTGYPRKELGEEGYRPEWSTIERFRLRFTGGTFRHSLETPVLEAKTNPGYIFKFEAEGYSSYITELVPANAGTVRFDLSLRPRRNHGVMVKLPDGRPASDVLVGIVFPETRFRLSHRGFGDDPDYSVLRRTDRSGILNLIEDGTVQRVVIPHASGYGEETMAALLDNPTLQIKPWGRVEGVYITDGKSMAGIDVILNFKEGNKKGVNLDREAFKATTDKQGKFYFKQVPFGQLTAQVSLPSVTQYGMQVRPFGQMCELEVRPGETTHLKLGGETYSFRGNIEWPREVVGSKASGVQLFLLAQGVSWEAAFKPVSTPGMTLLAKGQNEEWSAKDLTPGNYTVLAKSFATVGTREQPRVTYYRGTVEVVLKEQESDTVVDFGRIELQKIDLKK